MPQKINYQLISIPIVGPARKTTDAAIRAEREWNPHKIYETKGENRGPDVVRYRYGEDDGNPWCATFFNYVYNPKHENGHNVFGLSDVAVKSTQNILKAAKKDNCFAAANSDYTPTVGDGLIWSNDDGSYHGHIGIVTVVYPDGSFDTIQGNNNDKVEKIRYSSVQDAMKRISSSGDPQTLQGFVKMTDRNAQKYLASTFENPDGHIDHPDAQIDMLA